MDRIAEKRLLEWKNRKGRKPLVLMGARQVGKTWLMHDFGKRNFARVHTFNFDSQKNLPGFFAMTQEPEEILPKLAALSGYRIDADHDLVIFDEVQECPDALNSLKYFCEKCPSLAIMAAGSLLGVRIGKNRKDAKRDDGGNAGNASFSYPVGKVELLDIEPLTFSEFLRAYDSGLHSFYESISGADPLPEIFHRKLLDAYDMYLFTGGMPEVVSNYLDRRDPQSVRKLLRDLVALYEDDIVKYNGRLDAAKILVVLRAVVPQLAKENEKFVYGALRDGARGRGYEDAIEWLVAARVVRRIHNLGAMKFPISAQEVRNAFKLYHLDVGLLREMAGIPQSALVTDADFDFKGALVENYVLQQLFGHGDGRIGYYSERADREIDFVIQLGMDVVPVEVKAGVDKKGATFKSYVLNKQPRYAIRFSRRNLRKDGGFTNIPLYLAPRFEACLPDEKKGNGTP